MTRRGCRDLKVHVADVRKPLLAVCDMNDQGQDVYFLAARPGQPARAYAQHVSSLAVTDIIRRGGRFEIDAEVLLPNPVTSSSSSSFGGQATQL